MRPIISVIVAIFIFAACQENSNIVNPDDQFEQVTLGKKTTVENSVRIKKQNFKVFYRDFLVETLDEEGNPYTFYDMDKIIKVSASYSWKGGEYDGKRFDAKVWVEGKDIDWNCGSELIRGNKDSNRRLKFNIKFDPKTLAVDFKPSPFSFASPVNIDIKWKGLTSDAVIEYQNSGTFGYISNNGSSDEPVNFDSIEYNVGGGQIKVFGAEVHHFSRYGFLR
jgi:hypothetical protein